MGIKNLIPSIIEHAPNCVEWVPIRKFAGKVVAVDANIYLRMSMYAKPTSPLRPDLPGVHLRGLHNLTTYLLSHGLLPSFIFDAPGNGPRTILKRLEVEKRKVAREVMKFTYNHERKRTGRLAVLEQAIFNLSSHRFPKKSTKEDTTVDSEDDGVINTQKIEPVLKEMNEKIKELTSTDGTSRAISAGVEVDPFANVLEKYCEPIPEKLPVEITEQKDLLTEEVKSEPETTQSIDNKRLILGGKLAPSIKEISELPVSDQLGMYLSALRHDVNEAVKSSDQSGMKPVIESLQEEVQLITEIFNKRSETDEEEFIKPDSVQDLYLIQERHKGSLNVLQNQMKTISNELLAECTELLEALRVPYFVVESQDIEAEALCAALCVAGLAEATVSEDTDTLILSDHPVIMKLFKSPDYAHMDDIMLIDMPQVRKEFGMTRDQFIDYCILLGTDFSNTIERIGRVYSKQYITEYGSIEEILDVKDAKGQPKWRPVTDNNGWQPEIPRQLFKNSANEYAQKIPEVLRKRIEVAKENWYNKIGMRKELEEVVEKMEVNGDAEGGLKVGSGEFRWPKSRNVWATGLGHDVNDIRKIIAKYSSESKDIDLSMYLELQNFCNTVLETPLPSFSNAYPSQSLITTTTVTSSGSSSHAEALNADIFLDLLKNFVPLQASSSSDAIVPQHYHEDIKSLRESHLRILSELTEIKTTQKETNALLSELLKPRSSALSSSLPSFKSSSLVGTSPSTTTNFDAADENENNKENIPEIVIVERKRPRNLNVESGHGRNSYRAPARSPPRPLKKFKKNVLQESSSSNEF
ncbi:hypothetical protein HK098_000106 [Nowakowskiella sp. JEL0407]|nr:hypothetical protein HK098_000106 [Nowakowskiella sp. JEL0407]